MGYLVPPQRIIEILACKKLCLSFEGKDDEVYEQMQKRYAATAAIKSYRMTADILSKTKGLLNELMN